MHGPFPSCPLLYPESRFTLPYSRNDRTIADGNIKTITTFSKESKFWNKLLPEKSMEESEYLDINAKIIWLPAKDTILRYTSINTI